MAITVSGTTITFNDGTTQTTAGGAPTTAQVLTATAGASLGAVGTYAMLWTNTGVGPGSTIAGSSTRYASAIGFVAGSAPSGTWRAMGWSANFGCTSCSQRVSAYLRIS